MYKLCTKRTAFTSNLTYVLTRANCGPKIVARDVVLSVTAIAQ